MYGGLCYFNNAAAATQYLLAGPPLPALYPHVYRSTGGTSISASHGIRESNANALVVVGVATRPARLVPPSALL